VKRPLKLGLRKGHGVGPDQPEAGKKNFPNAEERNLTVIQQKNGTQKSRTAQTVLINGGPSVVAHLERSLGEGGFGELKDEGSARRKGPVIGGKGFPEEKCSVRTQTTGELKQKRCLGFGQQGEPSARIMHAGGFTKQVGGKKKNPVKDTRETRGMGGRQARRGKRCHLSRAAKSQTSGRWTAEVGRE